MRWKIGGEQKTEIVNSIEEILKAKTRVRRAIRRIGSGSNRWEQISSLKSQAAWGLSCVSRKSAKD